MFIVFILSIFSVPVFSISYTVCASGCNYTSIQDAIDSANPRDTILVKDGNYTENVKVNKSVNLVSENGADKTTVIAKDSYDHIFDITSDHVNISGFNVRGAGWWWHGIGIYLNNVNHCTIFDNNASNNRHGIYLSSSNNNTLTSNTANSNDDDGIYLSSSNNNTLTSNTANSNDDDGIFVYYSNNNIFINNSVDSNDDGGFKLRNSNDNIFIDNIADSNNYTGIDLYYHSYRNTFTSNSISNNKYNGISLLYSSNNTFTGNIVDSNKDYGIKFYSSSNNTLLNNTFIKNGLSVSSSYNNTIKNNTVNNKPLAYYEDTSDILIQDAGQVVLVNCSNITVKDLNISYASVGIELKSTNDCKITNNIISNNIIGISLSSSINNTLLNNIFIKNGLYVLDSHENIIENNTVNNKPLAYYEDTSDILIQDAGQVVLVNCSNITVKDLNISYASTGIQFSNTNDCKILNNIVSNNYGGISLSHSDNNIFIGNSVDSNGGDDIWLFYLNNNWHMPNSADSNNGGGIVLWSSNNNTFINNSADSNNGRGFELWDSNNNIFINNSADSNNYIGIDISSSFNNTFTENTIDLNEGGGIELWSSNNNTFINNSADSNNYPGIDLYYSDSNIFTNNTVSNNEDDGISLQDSNNNTLLNNSVNSNDDGISLDDSVNNTLTDNTLSNNSISLCNSVNNILTGNTGSNNGIYLYSSSDDNILTGNTVSNNYYGISLSSSSNNNILTGNTASNNKYDGIRLSSSSDNTLTSNIVSNNKWDGITLDDSNNNTLLNNSVNSNNDMGISLESSSNNIIIDNTVSNNYYGIPLYSSSDNTLTSNIASNNSVGISLFDSSDNTLTDNTANLNKYYGIYLSSSVNNILTGNTVSNNDDGIYLWSSSDNTLTGNTVNSNNDYGIWLRSSSDNNYIYNNYLNNTNNIYFYRTTYPNTWNTTKTQQPNIVGGPYIAGNYYTNPTGTGYSDTCTDTDEDGFCDSPYTIKTNNIDYLPLTFFIYDGITVCASGCNYTKIQNAINSANTGDTILVKNGNYTENIKVNKSLTIKSEYGVIKTTVIAENSNDHVFEVTADYVNISGFSIGKATGSNKAGIYLNNVNHCNIFDNNVSNNDYGIWLNSSFNNYIYNNYLNNTNNINISRIYTNLWNTTKTPSTNIIGDSYRGGNYYTNPTGTGYSDTCTDADKDGICDTPYILSTNNTDYLPLTFFINVEISVCASGCNHTTIQEAINSANLGDTILVKDGNYTENVNVNKPVNIVSENGAKKTTVIAKDSYDHIFEVTVDYVNISGFSVTKTKGWAGAGIYLKDVNYCNIFDNKVSNNNIGISLRNSNDNTLLNNTLIKNGLSVYDSYKNTVKNNTVNNKPLVYYEDTSDVVISDAGQVVLVKCSNMTIKNLNLSYANVGIELWQTNNCNILNNTASNNKYGIHLYYSSSNILVNNTVSNNLYGIHLYYSSSNILVNNTVSNNLYGIHLYYSSSNILANNTASSNYDGLNLWYSNSNNLTGNIADLNNRYGIYLRSSSSNTLTDNTANLNKGYGIYLSSSVNNILTGNTASNNDDGIYLEDSSNNILISNTASNNDGGIYLEDSSNNILVNNIADSNNWNGIYHKSSNNNTFINNTASNNNYGIYLRSSNGNTFTNNTASNNDDGIYLYHSNGNTLTGNIADSNNNLGGIHFDSSSDNTLINNIVNSNNDYGIYLTFSSNNTLLNNKFIKNGLSVFGSYDNVITNNTVNNKPLVYYEDTSNIVIPDAGQVVLINCSNITVKNLNLSYASIGIELFQTNNCKILNNTASNNKFGIYLYSSDSNTLTDNTANLNKDYGIYLYSSVNNILTSNTASNNDKYGIYLRSSSDNTFTNNTASNNNYGIYLRSSSDNNTLTGNTVSNNDRHGIYLSSSSDGNTFTGNTVSNNDDGIYLYFSDNNILTGNTASNNNIGIRLSFSVNNILTGNTASNNDDGIYLEDSSNNNLYNNYFNNTNNTNFEGWWIYKNTWNTAKTQETNIIGGPYIGGNYYTNPTGTGYSDTCTDTDKDGFCDTPYTIANKNIDYLPLTLCIDTIPPITTATAIDSTGKPYTFNTKTNSTYINVTLTSNEPGTTQYCIDTSNTCTPDITYTTPIQITINNTIYIRFQSNDTAGNIETTKNRTIIYYSPELDYIIENITIEGILEEGNIITIKSAVKNIGSGNAQKTTDVAIFIDDIKKEEIQVPKLPSTHSYIAETTWTVTPGNHTVKAIADYSNTLSESNESNNELQQQLQYIQYCDLKPTAYEIIPDNYIDGDSILLKIEISNLGVSTDKNIMIDIYKDNTKIASESLNGLSGSKYIFTTLNIIPGTHNISVRIDPNNQIEELNESNNILNFSLLPVGYPDIIPDGLVWEPEFFSVGQKVTLTGFIKNIGADTHSDITFKLYIDDDLIETCILSELNKSSPYKFEGNWTATYGAHTYKVTTDYLDNVIESNESNNIKETIIPDLNQTKFNIYLSSDKDVYYKNETTIITGFVSFDNGTPVTNNIVNVKITVKEFTRSIDLKTGNDGIFQVLFKPSSNEGGNYTVKATTTKWGLTKSDNTNFSRVVLRLIPKVAMIKQFKTQPVIQNIKISNIAEVPITGLDVNLISSENVTMDPQLNTLDLQPLETVSVNISFESTIDTKDNVKAYLIVNNSKIYETSIIDIDYLDPFPHINLTPGIIDTNLNLFDLKIIKVNISNDGFGVLEDVNIISNTSSPWVYVMSNMSLGDIDAGASKEFEIAISSIDNSTIGFSLHQFIINSSNHADVDLYVKVHVFYGENGTVNITVKDNYFNEPIDDVKIKLYYEKDPYVTYTMHTDNGTAIFNDMPIGKYRYLAVKKGYSTKVDQIEITPGNSSVEIIMDMKLLDIDFNVTEKTIDDKYEVILNMSFHANVSVPVIQPVPFVLVHKIPNGTSATDHFDLYNLGMIKIVDVKLSTDIPGFDVEFLSDEIDEIRADTGDNSASVPYKVIVPPDAPEGSILKGTIFIEGQFIALKDDVYHKFYIKPRQLPIIVFVHKKEVPDPKKVFSGIYICDIPETNIIEKHPDLYVRNRNPWQIKEVKIESIDTDDGMIINYPTEPIAVMNPNSKSYFGLDIFVISDEGEYKDNYYGTVHGTYRYLDPKTSNMTEVNETVTINIDVKDETELCTCKYPKIGDVNWIILPDGNLVIIYNMTDDIDDLLDGYVWYDFTYSPDADNKDLVPDTPPLPTPNGDAEVKVKIQIHQDVILERQAFDANLKMTNLWNTPLDNVNVSMNILDKDRNDSYDNFFVAEPVLLNIDSISNGTLNVDTTAEIFWFIIPKKDAGGTTGLSYNLSANISAELKDVGNFSFVTGEDQIKVNPMPLIDIIYLLPRTVKADEPFKLFAYVKNNGYGTAYNLRIDSVKHEIIEDVSSLKKGFIKIAASYKGVDTLLVNFGDIEPGEDKLLGWILKTEIDGWFKDFTAEYVHSDELGGEATSLIDNVNATYYRIFIHNSVCIIPLPAFICGQEELYFLEDFMEVMDPEDEIFYNVSLIEESDFQKTEVDGTSFVITPTSDFYDEWGLLKINLSEIQYTQINSVKNKYGLNLHDTQYWIDNGSIFILDKVQESYLIDSGNESSSPPSVTLISPKDNYVTKTDTFAAILFNCSATDDNNLSKISLYLKNIASDNFTEYKTENVNGTSATVFWNITGFTPNNTFIWNCKAYNLEGKTAFAESNRTIYVISNTAADNIVYVDDDFTDDPSNHKWNTIQEGVDDAEDGWTVIVKDGTYTENVKVNKSVNLVSENGADKTIVITKNDSDYPVFKVTVNYVNISGFTEVRTGFCFHCAGIYLNNVNHCSISDNIVSDNTLGIYLISSDNNTLVNNTVSDNTHGISLSSSSNNLLQNNKMLGNTYNFHIYGTNLTHYLQDIDITNTVDGKPIYYLVNHHDYNVPIDAGFVGMVNSTNITVEDLTMLNNGQGILFAFTTESIIKNVNASNNFYGINLYSSNSNTLVNNNVSNNDAFYTGQGVHLSHSDSNTLVNNTVSDNTRGISLSSSDSNTLTNNNVSDNGFNGIHLYHSDSNTLVNNTVSNNIRGILLSSSDSNTLTNNNVSDNGFNGIHLSSSFNNHIYNNYLNNMNNIYITETIYTNIWNTIKTAETNIVGGPYIGGNYYSNPIKMGYSDTCTDLDKDGFCDIPYTLATNNIDYLPLTINTSEENNPPSVTLISPQDNYVAKTDTFAAILFNCSATDDNNLSKISLYLKNIASDNFTEYRTESVTGTSATVSWNITGFVPNNTFIWNCKAYDLEGKTAFAESNRTLSVMVNTTQDNTTQDNNTVYVDDDFTDDPANHRWNTIQEGIDDAEDGWTVIVKDGNYTENVKVNKPVTIKSENGAEKTIVQVNDSHNPIFEVIVDYVNLSGFTIMKGKHFPAEKGIYFYNVNYCNVFNNIILNNGYGVFLRESTSNMLFNNTILNNNVGIFLSLSSNNILINNTANSNDEFGIRCYNSANNTLINNSVNSNHKNGIVLSHSNNNYFKNNIILNNNFGIDIDSTSNNNIIYQNFLNNKENDIFSKYINTINKGIENTCCGGTENWSDENVESSCKYIDCSKYCITDDACDFSEYCDMDTYTCKIVPQPYPVCSHPNNILEHGRCVSATCKWWYLDSFYNFENLGTIDSTGGICYGMVTTSILYFRHYKNSEDLYPYYPLPSIEPESTRNLRQPYDYMDDMNNVSFSIVFHQKFDPSNFVILDEIYHNDVKIFNKIHKTISQGTPIILTLSDFSFQEIIDKLWHDCQDKKDLKDYLWCKLTMYSKIPRHVVTAYRIEIDEVKNIAIITIYDPNYPNIPQEIVYNITTENFELYSSPKDVIGIIEPEMIQKEWFSLIYLWHSKYYVNPLSKTKYNTLKNHSVVASDADISIINKCTGNKAWIDEVGNSQTFHTQIPGVVGISEDKIRAYGIPKNISYDVDPQSNTTTFLFIYWTEDQTNLTSEHSYYLDIISNESHYYTATPNNNSILFNLTGADVSLNIITTYVDSDGNTGLLNLTNITVEGNTSIKLEINDWQNLNSTNETSATITYYNDTEITKICFVKNNKTICGNPFTWNLNLLNPYATSSINIMHDNISVTHIETENTSITTELIKDILYNLSISGLNDTANILLSNVNLTESNNLTIALDKFQSNPNTTIYAIELNHSKWNPANTDLRLSYENLNKDNIKLYKCNNWNFTEKKCSSNWYEIPFTIDENNTQLIFNVSSLSAFKITDYEPYCGDNICDQNENCSSCPQDCGECKDIYKIYGFIYDINGFLLGNANIRLTCNPSGTDKKEIVHTTSNEGGTYIAYFSDCINNSYVTITAKKGNYYGNNYGTTSYNTNNEYFLPVRLIYDNVDIPEFPLQLLAPLLSFLSFSFIRRRHQRIA